VKKSSYLLRLVLFALLSVSALTPLPRTAAQQTPPASGSEQTPIDIRNEELTFDANLPALGFSYGTKVTLDVFNNGSPGEFATVRADVPDGAGELTVTGCGEPTPAGCTYKLLQFHWHAPSEHELNGEKFPMEMHLVHRSAAGKLSVVGVWIKSGKENKELKKLFADLPAQTGEHHSVKHFNLTRLLPESLESYRYTGSLTTPNFDEGVRWVVLAEPIEMSAEQLAAFKLLFPDGNSREIQPLNGRTVFTDVAPPVD
jgi:carbonic anhydrase